MKNDMLRGLGRKLPLILALSGFAVAVQAAPVQPPPLPPGSDKVRIEAGLSKDEVKRQTRAHNHSRLGKRDHTRDDSLDALPAPTGNGQPPQAPGKPAAQ